ncbi:hypothetical protein [Dysosmobacter sp. Phy]
MAAIAAMLPALFRAASGPAVSDLMSVLGISIGLGLVGALVAALVLAGCAIAHLVMLWKTGRFFRDLRPVDPPLPPAGEDAAL